VLGYTQGRWSRSRLRIEPVDTNGAGDVFHGACAVGELRDWPLEWTLTFSQCRGAMKCRHAGVPARNPATARSAGFLASHGHASWRPPSVDAGLTRSLRSLSSHVQTGKTGAVQSKFLNKPKNVHR